MKFYVRKIGDRVAGSYPFVLLGIDPWDDFNFKTTFSVEIWLGPNDVASLGEVKILDINLPNSGGRVALPSNFVDLPQSMISLGQSYTYYETLRNLPHDVHNLYLTAIQDIVYRPALKAAFESHPAYTSSLLRNGSAVRALEDSPPLFYHGARAGQEKSAELSFIFNTHVGGGTFAIPFHFCDSKHLPNRINAIIGYNGVGKTTLLANLAMIASANIIDRRSLHVRHGDFGGDSDLAFGATIAVSYSAFDTFEIPGRTEAERARVESRGELFGYAYCGLRKIQEESSETERPARRPDNAPLALKDSSEITDEFLSALRRAQKGSRREILQLALDTLALEPSFARVGMDGFLSDADDLRTATKELARLSTGHKIVLNIVVQLIAHLQERSLVLIDEPESHLHPPLLAALLRSVSVALQRRDSFAVVATHSPVVLQEIPKRYVRVLQRFGDVTRIDIPESETFGENVGLLTRTRLQFRQLANRLPSSARWSCRAVYS